MQHTNSVQLSSVLMGNVEYSQLNQYIIIKDLGRGAHALVKLALNTADNLLYAIKVMYGFAPCQSSFYGRLTLTCC